MLKFSKSYITIAALTLRVNISFSFFLWKFNQTTELRLNTFWAGHGEESRGTWIPSHNKLLYTARIVPSRSEIHLATKELSEDCNPKIVKFNTETHSFQFPVIILKTDWQYLVVYKKEKSWHFRRSVENTFIKTKTTKLDSFYIFWDFCVGYSSKSKNKLIPKIYVFQYRYTVFIDRIVFATVASQFASEYSWSRKLKQKRSKVTKTTWVTFIFWFLIKFWMILCRLGFVSFLRQKS